MPLAPALAFKLTVAREQRPEIYEHSLQMTLIALFLAIKSRLPDRDLADRRRGRHAARHRRAAHRSRNCCVRAAASRRPSCAMSTPTR